MFLAVDVEAYEYDHSVLLEVGISALTLTQTHTIHLIIGDNHDFRNGRFVPDRKQDFAFGQSMVVSLSQLPDTIYDFVRDTNIMEQEVVLVGHSVHNDQKWLRDAGIVFDIKKEVDIAEVEKTLTGDYQPRKLSALGEKYGVVEEGWDGWHNAGNDAHLTLQVAIRQKEVLNRMSW